ncbi:MAG: hypothetical protein ACE5HQ_00105 [Gemmatimonadota bacterium]
MMRSLLVWLTVGAVGLMAAGVVFSLLIPLAVLAIRICFVALVGYLILRLLRPDLADRLRDSLRGTGDG